MTHLTRDTCIWEQVVLWHNSFTCSMTHWYVPWLIHMCHGSFEKRWLHLRTGGIVAWLIYMWHDSVIYDLVDLCVLLLVCTWHDSFVRGITCLYVTWLIDLCHDSLICAMTRSYVTWLIRQEILASENRWYCGMTHLCAPRLIEMCHDSLICDMTHTTSDFQMRLRSPPAPFQCSAAHIHS